MKNLNTIPESKLQYINEINNTTKRYLLMRWCEVMTNTGNDFSFIFATPLNKWNYIKVCQSIHEMEAELESDLSEFQEGSWFLNRKQQ